MQEKVAYIFLPRSILCMPITIRGNVIGVVQMINKKSGEGMFTRVSRLIGVNRSKKLLCLIFRVKVKPKIQKKFGPVFNGFDLRLTFDVNRHQYVHDDTPCHL